MLLTYLTLLSHNSFTVCQVISKLLIKNEKRSVIALTIQYKVLQPYLISDRL